MTPKQKATALRTIVRKEVKRIFRVWGQTLMPSAISITLYFVVFGAFIGSQLRDIEGFSYMQFIVPGLIMMAIINNSYTNVVGSFFIAKFQSSIEEMLVSPMPNWILLLGYCLGGVVRGFIVGVIVTAVSLFFVPLYVHNITIVITVAVLTSLFFSLGGFTNAVFAKSFDDVSIVPTFVLMPLVFLGGVFYSIDMLPDFWQTVSHFNPLLYIINGFRYGFLGISDINIWIGVGALAVFVVVLWVVNIILLRKGVGLKE